MKIRILVRRGLLAASLMVAGGGVVALGSSPAGASNKQVTAAGSFTTYNMMHNIFGPSLHDLLPGGKTSAQFVKATATYCAGGVAFTTPTTSHNLGGTTKLGAPNGSTAGKKYLYGEQSTTKTKKECVTFSRSSSPPVTGTGSTVNNASDFDYYAYALDGVAPMVGSNAGGTREHPVTLTLYDMKQIYLCKPGYTTWKTVTGTTAPSTIATPTGTVHNTKQGGVTGAIVRFWPQTGSGTRSVYTSMMGFTPDKTTKGTATHHSTCTTRPTTKFATVTVHTVTVAGTPHGIKKETVTNEENTEDGLIYYNSLHPGALTNAIFIYSSGKFEQEWNNTSVYNSTGKNSINNVAIGRFTATHLYLAQMRNTKKPGSTSPFVNFGAQSGTFTKNTNRGTEAINTTVVKEANEWFSHITTNTKGTTTSSAPVAGVRYVFNVADTALPTYSEAKMMIGFDNRATGAKSALCHGDDSQAIIASGFVPLNKGTTAPANDGGGGTTAKFGGTSDLAGSYCREFPGHQYPSWGGHLDWTTSTFVQAT